MKASLKETNVSRSSQEHWKHFADFVCQELINIDPFINIIVANNMTAVNQIERTSNLSYEIVGL